MKHVQSNPDENSLIHFFFLVSILTFASENCLPSRSVAHRAELISTQYLKCKYALVEKYVVLFLRCFFTLPLGKSKQLSL